MSFTFAGYSNPIQACDLVTGVPVAAAAYTVYQSDGTTAAVCYTSRLKTTTTSNSGTANSDGVLSFYTDPGTYVLALQSRTYTLNIEPDPAEYTITVTQGPLLFTDARIGGALDGSTDNGPSGTNAFANAATLFGARGGELFIGPGIAQFATQPAALPSNVRLVGSGKNATILRKAFTGAGLLRFEGASTSSRCARGGLSDLQVAGDNTHTGALLTATFADHLNFDRVWFLNNVDCAVVATELWDSYFRGCEFEYVGTSTGRTGASVRLLGSATDKTNEIYFAQCRWESFPGNAVFVDSNSTGNAPYGIWFSQCKMESAFVHGVPFISTTNDVNDVHFRDLYLAADAIPAGGSATDRLVNFIAAQNLTFDGVHVYIGGGAATGVFNVFPGTVGHSIKNVFVDSASLTNGIINWAGGNPKMSVENVGYKSGTGTVHAGTVPSKAMLRDSDVLTGRRSSQSGAYTFVLDDAGTVVEYSGAGAAAFTIPPNSSVPYPVGAKIGLFQYGAGQATWTAGAGVTLRADGAHVATAGQYALTEAVQRAQDEWVITGDRA